MNHNPATPPVEPAVTISVDPAILTVIERFDVAADQQGNAIEQAADHIRQHWKNSADFVGAFLLRGRDHGGLCSYSQWKRPADAAPVAPAAYQSLTASLSAFTCLDARTYSVEFDHQEASVSPPTQVSLKQSPNAHFGVFRVKAEHQDALLERARENAPNSLLTPDLGLRSITFHRSLDGLQVINLGTWSTLANFRALLQQPDFRDENVYWAGLADFQPDFFDVVVVEGKQEPIPSPQFGQR